MEPLGKCTGDTLGKWFDIKLQLEDRKWKVMSDNISAEKHMEILKLNFALWKLKKIT